ncbi:MAG: peroxiredoxin family protein [Bryobacteraceae bacterium]
MDAMSMASAPERAVPASSAWKTIAGTICAVIIAVLFLSSGIWKISDPIGWSRNLEHFLVPLWGSAPLTLALAIGETLAGVLVLIPAFRRWGAALASLLLLSFLVWVAWHYNKLVGADCSCFPLIKRAVGPMFFPEDGAMLLAAILAGIWAPPTRAFGKAVGILALIAATAGASYGWALSHQSGAKAPDSITVDGKPFSLQQGRIFLFFYDPNCGHCDAAARGMAKMHWKSGVTIIGIPTEMPRYAAAFVRETGIKALTSLDVVELKKIFPFGDPPYGVALEDGREIGPVAQYNDADENVEPAGTLRKLGFIE